MTGMHSSTIHSGLLLLSRSRFDRLEAFDEFLLAA